MAGGKFNNRAERLIIIGGFVLRLERFSFTKKTSSLKKTLATKMGRPALIFSG